MAVLTEQLAHEESEQANKRRRNLTASQKLQYSKLDDFGQQQDSALSLTASTLTFNATPILTRLFDRKMNEFTRMVDLQFKNHVDIIKDKGITARNHSLVVQTKEQAQIKYAHQVRTAALTIRLQTEVVTLLEDFRQACTRARNKCFDPSLVTDASQTALAVSTTASLQGLKESSKTLLQDFRHDCKCVREDCVALPPNLASSQASLPDAATAAIQSKTDTIPVQDFAQDATDVAHQLGLADNSTASTPAFAPTPSPGHTETTEHASKRLSDPTPL